jgi:hypothetical protein
MDEQIAHRYRQTTQGQRIQRQSQGTREQERQRHQTASPHRVGHSAGLHPEDQPYDSEEDEVYDDVWPPRLPTSARRYTSSSPQVIQQGNRRFIIHDNPPPRRYHYEDEPEPPSQPRIRPHFLVFVGLVLLIMIGGFVALSALGSIWQGKLDDWTYGQTTRTYQTDAVVGHSDSPGNPTHIIALNLRGTIMVIELPGGDASKARSYTITTIPGNSGNPPVKVSFQDLNSDGKLDMLIQIGDPGSIVTIILFNNGQQFVSKL